ncbi:polyisoprenoid-binding protein [Streptomyces sp. MBT84]|uniref:polyisoprenoid-binding protein n=1 Tax=Streptomyces sp. MBT84 TaxID=1488414 RepID=UPI001C6EDDC0
MVTEVRGGFTAFEGFGRLDAHRPARSGAHVSVQDEQPRPGRLVRDSRIAGPGFLDAAAFPLILFRSIAVVPGRGRLRHNGEPADQERRTAAAPRPRLRRRRPRRRRAAADRLRGLGHPPATGASPGTSDKVRLELSVSALLLGPEAPPGQVSARPGAPASDRLRRESQGLDATPANPMARSGLGGASERLDRSAPGGGTPDIPD